jgi:hypothetical protein
MMRRAPPIALLALAAMPLLGCASHPAYRDGVYSDGSVAFRTGPLPAEWRRARVHGGGVAFHHRRGGTVFANVLCDRPDDVPLDVLTNHLLFGIEEQREVSRQPLMLDGRAALRTRVDGKLDGVFVVLDLVVLKRDGCTYDLHLVAGPAAYPERKLDFDRFVEGFAH